LGLAVEAADFYWGSQEGTLNDTNDKRFPGWLEPSSRCRASENEIGERILVNIRFAAAPKVSQIRVARPKTAERLYAPS
jgi:hypothetical protein